MTTAPKYWFPPALYVEAWADFWTTWLGWLTRLMAEDRMPLSGDVTQWIRAWGEAVGQIGLFNFNYAGSSDPQTERRIGSRYSYGRQLGRMLEVLVPYFQKHADEFTGEEEIQALKDFRDMASEIDALKQASVDELLDKVRHWRKSPQFNQKLAELKRGLEVLGKA